jgi:hypothetical protein
MLRDLPDAEAETLAIRAWRRAINRSAHSAWQERERERRLAERVCKDVRYMSGWQLTSHVSERHPGMDPSSAPRFMRHADDHRARGDILGHVHPELESRIQREILAFLATYDPPRVEPRARENRARPDVSARGRTARFRRAGIALSEPTN